MKKIGRNDPCPCGSGLKYKKCCGKNNVITFNPLQLDQELVELHDELIDFSFANYEKEIKEITFNEVEMHALESGDENIESYVGLIFPWIVINEPIDNNQTVFELFSKQRMGRIRKERVKRAFASWENATSSIFEIISVDNIEEEEISIRDSVTNEMYNVVYEDVNKENIGDYIVGTLLSLVQSNYFMFSTIEISKEGKDFIYAVLDDFDADENLIREMFPEFLGDLFEPHDDDLEWPDPIHVEVAQQFAYHMDKKNVDKDTIYNGILFWNHYCLKHDPYVVKTSTYAAALNYFISRTYLVDDNVTQAALAKEYDVSPTSISSHFQSFMNEAEVILMNDSSNEALLDDNPLGIEKEMKHLQKIISEEEFESVEELETYLDGILESGSIDDLMDESEESMAQELVYEAVGKRGKERKKLIEQALQLDPNNIDAYVLLAEEEANLERSHDLLTNAITIGDKQFGKRFFVENKGHFWGMIETRPYMRAKESLAHLLAVTGREDEAIEVYEELLVLNPNDNQGVRSVLLSLYIEFEMYKEALQLIRKYSEYPETDFLYSHALLQFLLNGNTKETKHLLKVAMEHNQYVVDYLIGRKKIPNEEIRYIQPREESEAIVYAQRNYHLWVDAIELFEQ